MGVIHVPPRPTHRPHDRMDTTRARDLCAAPLAGLMAGAMALNLAIASVAGVLIPYGLHKLGRDPVMGSSVILTAITDSMGFFIFLRQRVGVGPGRGGYR